jgi:integrase
MSVYKPKNSSIFLYDFQHEGARFHGSTGEHKRRKAEAEEARVRADVRNGNIGKDLSLDRATGDYWSVSCTSPSAKHIEYQSARLIEFFGATTFIRHITNNSVADYITTARGRHYGKRKVHRVSNGSVNREIALLRSILYRAKKTRGANIQDIAWKDHWLKEPRPRDRVLSDIEERDLLANAAEHLQAPIRFALLTGLRQGNTIDLDWSQIDLKAKTMTFTVKGGKSLVLPITDEILVLLANQGPNDSGPVFTYKGERIKSWRKAFGRAKERAGITNFRWHDLRHTAASRMVARGVPLSLVQEILAHEDISTTRRYVHHRQDDKLAALESLSRRNPEEPGESRAK